MRFYKYHALGNDYLVLNPADFPDWPEPSPEQIRIICHRNFGVGSDGILWGPLPAASGAAAVRIFNPDGSEAEKSGNGLRIFARYLWDHHLVPSEAFTIETIGGAVTVKMLDAGRHITIGMGRVSFASAQIPVAGPPREVLNETLQALDREFVFSAATIGNPHCVIPLPAVSADLARRYGPAVETHPLFPRKTNVQFMEILDRTNLRIEIWERGAGYTLASGSSSSAAAAVAHRLGLADSHVTVRMPGGNLAITISPQYEIQMTGPACPVASGRLEPEMFTATNL